MAHFEWTSRGYTDEKQNLVQLLLTVVKDLPHRRQWLDIGPGSGEIARAISPAFTSTVFVEPRTTELQPSATSEMIQARWEDVPLATVQARFDLIVCSHALYYMSENTIEQQVRKMFQSLTTRGTLALVVNAPETLLARYHARVYPMIKDPLVKWTYSRLLTDALHRHYSRLRRCTIHSVIAAPNADVLVHLLCSISGAGHDRDRSSLVAATWRFVEEAKLVQHMASPVSFPLQAHAYLIEAS